MSEMEHSISLDGVPLKVTSNFNIVCITAPGADVRDKLIQAARHTTLIRTIRANQIGPNDMHHVIFDTKTLDCKAVLWQLQKGLS
jgi:hypothetical protein